MRKLRNDIPSAGLGILEIGACLSM